MKYRLLFILPIVFFIGCDSKKTDLKKISSTEIKKDSLPINVEIIIPQEQVKITRDIHVNQYFEYMDSLTSDLNKNRNYILDEYILVHNNPWILDTLAHTDYYYLKELGVFSEDPRALTVLPKNSSLIIPDSLQTATLRLRMKSTYLDVNIPEFRLRIMIEEEEKYNFPIRVGKNSKRYLAMVNREVDLRTKPGVGKIIRVNKDARFINPRDNHRYHVTKRDDGKVTYLPRIPWLEPEINGQRHGQLIHPTTNLNTLSKAYSNGCIGLRESDAWIVYYYAPIGTKVIFRYDLEIINEKGEQIRLENIYPGFENKGKLQVALAASLPNKYEEVLPICECGIIE